MKSNLEKSVYLGLAALTFASAANGAALNVNAKSHKRVKHSKVTYKTTKKDLDQTVVFKSTGKNAIYTKPNGVKGAKVLVSKKQMQAKAKSKNVKDQFMAYQMAVNNKGYHYYKVVSFDKKIRGYVFNKGIVKTNVKTTMDIPAKKTGKLNVDSLYDEAYGTKFSIKAIHFNNDGKRKFTIKKAAKVNGNVYYNVADNNDSSVNGWVSADNFTASDEAKKDDSNNNPKPLPNSQPAVVVPSTNNSSVTPVTPSKGDSSSADKKDDGFKKDDSGSADKKDDGFKKDDSGSADKKDDGSKKDDSGSADKKDETISITSQFLKKVADLAKNGSITNVRLQKENGLSSGNIGLHFKYVNNGKTISKFENLTHDVYKLGTDKVKTYSVLDGATLSHKEELGIMNQIHLDNRLNVIYINNDSIKTENGNSVVFETNNSDNNKQDSGSVDNHQNSLQNTFDDFANNSVNMRDNKTKAYHSLKNIRSFGYKVVNNNIDGYSFNDNHIKYSKDSMPNDNNRKLASAYNELSDKYSLLITTKDISKINPNA